MDGAASLLLLVRAAGLPDLDQDRTVGGDGDGVAIGKSPLILALPQVADGLAAEGAC